MRPTLLAGLAAALAILGAGWDTQLPAAAAPPPGPLPAAVPLAASRTAPSAGVHEAGRAVYNFRCYFCHGYSGNARTLAATYLEPPPRDFTAVTMSVAEVASAVRAGRAGTAMKPFASVIDEAEIAAVSVFVVREFMQDKAPNTRYHTAENGWPDHERYEPAFAFARGDVALDAPADELSGAQHAGRRLFLSSCVSCHDRALVRDNGPAWSARPVSYPRVGFEPGQPNKPAVDGVSSASIYARHEVPPDTQGLSPQQRRGAQLFQANCAFCHGADGTGKNWIGQFMEPKARDLTAYTPQTMPPALLKQRIREGLPGTSMPAWQHVLGRAEIDALAAYVMRVMVRSDAALVAASSPSRSPR